MMEIRFKKKKDIINVSITIIAALVSVALMLYGVWHFGLKETWPELIINLFYIACIVMMWLFFFNRLEPNHFYYWCSLCVGITVLLRDILFPPQLANYPLHLGCLVLSVALLLLITYFYARKEWENFSKSRLELVYIIDMVIAILYHIAIVLEPSNEYTKYFLTEIWIRPTITYGLVACFIKGRKAASETNHQ